MTVTRSALLVIDMQNDFCRPGAPYEVTGSLSLAPRINNLLRSWREKKNPIAFTRYVAHSSIRPLAEKLPWVRQLEAPVNACVPGYLRLYEDTIQSADCIDVVDELAPLSDEAIFDKVFYSGFHGTRLMEYLAERDVNSVVLTGIVTEMCVAETARHAAHYGLKAAIVSDACLSRSDTAHAAALRDFDSNYGWVINSDQAIRWLEGSGF